MRVTVFCATGACSLACAVADRRHLVARVTRGSAHTVRAYSDPLLVRSSSA